MGFCNSFNYFQIVGKDYSLRIENTSRHNFYDLTFFDVNPPLAANCLVSFGRRLVVVKPSFARSIETTTTVQRIYKRL